MNRSGKLFFDLLYLACACAVIIISRPAPAADELVILSPHWEGIRREFERAFAREHLARTNQAVHVQWLDVGAASNIMNYLRAEYAAHPEGVNVDLMWGGGAIYFQALAGEGMLAPLNLPQDVLSRIPDSILGESIIDPQGLWIGSALSGFGILYNRRVLEMLNVPEPATWSDMTDTRLFSWVALADPRESGSAHMMYEIVLQTYGFERGFGILTSIAANSRSISKGASQIPTLVATGEVACAPAIDFYAWSKILEVKNDSLGFVLPDAQTVIQADPIAVLKGAPHPDLAREFIGFVLSEQGQSLWMLPAGAPNGPGEFTLSRMSVTPELYQKLGNRSCIRDNPFKKNKSLSYDSALGSKRWQIINDLIGVCLIDHRARLSQVFSAVLHLPQDNPLFQDLMEPPLREPELSSLTGQWKDQALRNQTIAQWVKSTEKKYDHVIAASGQAPAPVVEKLRAGLRYTIPLLLIAFLISHTIRAGLRQSRIKTGGIKV